MLRRVNILRLGRVVETVTVDVASDALPDVAVSQAMQVALATGLFHRVLPSEVEFAVLTNDVEEEPKG